MSNLISIIYYAYPFFVLLLDFKELYKKFSRDSKIIGLIALILSILLFLTARISLYFILNMFKVKEGIFTAEINLSAQTYNYFINVVDLFLWMLVKRLYQKENGIGIIRLIILYGIEAAFLVPFAFTLYVVIVNIFHINLH